MLSGRHELAHLLIDAYATRAEWLSSRAAPDVIGASDAAIVLGVSPYGTPWSLWESKRATANDNRSAVLQRGHRWEPSVLAEYADESTHEVLSPDIACQVPRGSIVVVANRRLPWLRQSPDAFAIDRSGELGQVEAKTALQAHLWSPEPGIVIDRWDDAHADIVPAHYAVQGYTQLIVSELPWVDLCALVPRGGWLGIRWVRLLRDPETQNAIEDALTQWRERHLVGGEPPPLDGSDACNRYLAKRYPSLSGKAKPSRLASHDELLLMLELANLRAQQKLIDARADELRNTLLEKAQGFRLLAGGHGKAPYGQPQQSDGRVTLDHEALRREVPPEVLERCKRQGNPYATFNLYRFDQVRAAAAAVAAEASEKEATT